MSKRLEAVLRKMKVSDLKKEISKQNIRGYSKMRKEEIINLMLDNKKRFKYLVLDNLKQKKELLEDKVKLKKAKEKLEKLTAEKIPAKKAEKAEVIKPKKREPMIPKVIKPKPQTIQKGGKFVTVKKELNDVDLLELELKNLQKELNKIKSPLDAKDSKEAQKLVELKDKKNSEISKVKVKLFNLKQKNKKQAEKDKKQKEKDELKEFRKNVEEFIKNPDDELLEEIDQKFELIDELPQFLQDNFDEAMQEYEKKEKKKQVDKKKEEPKKEPNKNNSIELATKESKNLKVEKDDNDINIEYNGDLDVEIELFIDLEENDISLEEFASNRNSNKIEVKKGFSRLLLCEILKNIQKKYKLKDNMVIMVVAGNLIGSKIKDSNPQTLFKKVYEPLGFKKNIDESNELGIAGSTTLKNIINKCMKYKEKF